MPDTTTPKKAPKSEPQRKRAAESTSEGGGDTRRPDTVVYLETQMSYSQAVDEAARHLGREYQECSEEAAEGLAEAYRRYLEGVLGTLEQGATYEKATAAYDGYLAAARNLADASEAVQLTWNSYAKLFEDLQAAAGKPDATVLVQRAYEDNAERLRRGWDRNEVEEAYRSAQDAFLVAWSEAQRGAENDSTASLGEWIEAARGVLGDPGRRDRLANAWKTYSEAARKAGEKAMTELGLLGGHPARNG